MAKKKLTNPIMTPEWMASLLDVCVVPTVALDEFGTMSDEQAKAIGALLEGASGEQSTAAPLPADPGLLEGIKFAIEDAERALNGAFESLRDAKDELADALRNIEELERDRIAADMPTNEALGRVFGSFPDMPLPDGEYGGGGMSADAIKLDDAYYTIKRLLQANSVTDSEVREFLDAVERLIR